jgi:hypothetical protein
MLFLESKELTAGSTAKAGHTKSNKAPNDKADRLKKFFIFTLNYEISLMQLSAQDGLLTLSSVPAQMRLKGVSIVNLLQTIFTFTGSKVSDTFWVFLIKILTVLLVLYG